MMRCKETLPHAKVAHGRFHLVRYLNEAIDKARRREVKVHEDLKKKHVMPCSKKASLTEKQRIQFEAIRTANYEVSKAWQVREHFKGLSASNKVAVAPK